MDFPSGVLGGNTQERSDPFSYRKFSGVCSWRAYYRDTRTYIDLTILSTAKAILDVARDPYQATIFVDGLGRSERHRFSAGLRKLRVKVNKVRGVPDQSEEFIRLADAVAGFVRDALEDDPAVQALFEQAKRSGFLKEV